MCGCKRAIVTPSRSFTWLTWFIFDGLLVVALALALATPEVHQLPTPRPAP